MTKQRERNEPGPITYAYLAIVLLLAAGLLLGSLVAGNLIIWDYIFNG